MFIALACALLLLAVVTALPAIASEAWWVRVFDFPRLQLMLVSWLLLDLALFGLDLSSPWSLGLVALGLACAASHTGRILLFTPLWKKHCASAAKAPPGPTVSILVVNVLTSNDNAAAVLALVDEKKPDLVLTLESDQWWQEQLEPLTRDYRHTIFCPQDNLYGMHLYSRYPLEDSSTRFLVQPDVPSMHALLRLPSGHGIRLHCLHPAPPFPGENELSTPRDAEVLVVARSIAGSSEPLIVAGDMNDVPWSRTLRSFVATSGLRDPRRGRGLYNTFHASHRLMRWPLDHIFVSRHFAVRALARSAHVGSDHFGYMATLVLCDESIAPEVAATEMDAADARAWAQEKLGEAEVDTDDVPAPGRDPQSVSSR